MASRIEQIIEEIEEYIDGCKYQALSSSKIIVNKDELEELLNELRSKTPEEIKRYQKIISNQDAILQEAHIRFASWLGCGVVGTETGAPNETYTAVPECHGEEALQTFITNLRPVVKYAEEMGVVMAIEPVWKHIVYNPARARRVLDEIASPNLQIILDPVNLLDYCNYKDQVAIVDEAIDVLGPDVAMVHLKDFIPEDGKLKSVGCGLGQMDYTSILKFMKERKPYIHATLEDTTPENNLQVKNFIQGLYDNL